MKILRVTALDDESISVLFGGGVLSISVLSISVL